MDSPRSKPSRLQLNSSVMERAWHHYRPLALVIVALRDALRELAAAMARTQEEYRLLIGRCRLLLYARKSATGQLRGLYWGRLCKLRDGRKWVKHLPGRLKRRAIYWAGKWQHIDVLEGFDERRLKLNRRRTRVSRALTRVAASLCRLRLPRTRLSPITYGADTLVTRAWQVAWACAVVEDIMVRIVRQRHPVRDLSPIFPYATVGKHGYLTVGWALPERITRDGRFLLGHRHVATKLTRQLLSVLKVARVLWPDLRLIDDLLRGLRAEHKRYAGVIGRVRRLARVVKAAA